MLKLISFKNNQFKDRQYLEFQRGPNFLIGPYSSNPNEILELINSCLSPNETQTLTSNQDDIAFTVCKFEFQNDFAIQIESILHRDCSDHLTTKLQQPEQVSLFACTFARYDETSHHKKQYKLVLIKKHFESNDKLSLFVKSVCISKDDIIPESTENLTFSNEDEIKKIARIIEILCSRPEQEKRVTRESHSDVSNGLSEILHILNNCSHSSEGCNLLPEIFQYLTESRVVTVQTRSRNLTDTSSSQTDSNVQNLMDLVDSDEIDSVENHTFKGLIHPLNYSFRKETTIERSDLKVDRLDSESITHPPLSQIPKEILEAKQLSLLAHNKKVQTLCLEEPGRSFDSSMQMRMRDMLLRQNDKVILLTSHSTSMIGPWTIPRTFVCRRKREYNCTDQYTVKLSDQNVHFVSNEDVKNILFASKVFIVEGLTDQILISVLFEQIIQSNGILSQMFQDADLKKLRHFVSTIQIIKQNGHKDKKKCEELCAKLQVSCFFLLDRNVLVMDDMETLKTNQMSQEINVESTERTEAANNSDSGNTHQDRNDMNRVDNTSGMTDKTKKEKVCRGYVTVLVNTLLNVSEGEDTMILQVLLMQLHAIEKVKVKTMKSLSSFFNPSKRHGKDDDGTQIVRDYKLALSEIQFPNVESTKESNFWSKQEHTELKECIINLDPEKLQTVTEIAKHASHFHEYMICPVGIRMIKKTASEFGLPVENLNSTSNILNKSDYEALEKGLKGQNIFMWNSGNLEHVINNAIMKMPRENLPTAFEIWEHFPIMKTKKESERHGKRALKIATEGQLKELCRCLFDDPLEIRRLIQFLVDMCRKYDK